MHEYEIRVLNFDDKPSIVAHEAHLNDRAAVRAGKKLAGSNNFEVWRNIECIYGAPAYVTSSPEAMAHPCRRD